MKYLHFFILPLAVTFVAFAEKTKDVERRVTVTAGQAVELRGLNSSDIEIKTWDKQEVYIRLHVEISSSNKDYEKEYIELVDFTEKLSSERAIITFSEPKRDMSEGFSFKKLLTLSFGNYVRKEITGEVFIPKKNAFTTDLKYGKMVLDDISGTIRLEGQSNTIRIRNCSALSWISNDYGTTTIDDSGGDLDLRSQSGKVEISNFTGSLTLNTDYTNTTVNKVSKGLRLSSKSATIKVSDIGADASIEADYSNVTVDRVKGYASISDKSGSIKVHSVDGVSIDAQYSNIEVTSVAGTGGKMIVIVGQSGQLDLTDVVGNVRIDNPYSTMDLKNVKGNVELKTTSGTIKADGVTGDWTSDTKYSKLTLRNLRAEEVTMENSSGEIDLDLLVVPKKLNIRNEYANVNVNIPQGLSASVRMKSEYGSVKTNLPLEVESFATGAIAMGNVGSGTGSFRVETKSGSVKVQQK